MARIRTIKPEFPQSESMGRVSRDARLLFVMLFTVVDDSGITRGNSRMLASLLFPYDEDAGGLIEGWFSELEVEGCVVRYLVEGQSYLQICNWLNHQKIDKPTPSKLPAFDSSREDSRILHVGKEGNGMERKGEEGKGVEPPKKSTGGTARGSRLPTDWLLPKTWGEWAMTEKPQWSADDVRKCAERFKDFWIAKTGKDATKANWEATWRNWVRRESVPAARPTVESANDQAREAARIKLFGGNNAAE